MCVCVCLIDFCFSFVFRCLFGVSIVETQRESLGNIMLDETKQVLADILPGGKRLFGKNNNSDNNNKNKKDGEKSS